MNLDNSTFLGDFDDHYTVKMLDGTLFELRYNLVNEHNLLGAIVDSADQVGIKLRRHRVRAILDEMDDRTYFVFQEPPNMNHVYSVQRNVEDTIVRISIASNENLLDAIDYFETNQHSDLGRVTLSLSCCEPFGVRLDTNELWKLLSTLYQPSVLELDLPTSKAEAEVITIFGDGIKELKIGRLSGEIVTCLCTSLPHLSVLILTDRNLGYVDDEWGIQLAACTNIQKIRFLRVYSREILRMKEGWRDWHITLGEMSNQDEYVSHRSAELTRFSFLDSYGALIDLDEVFT